MARPANFCGHQERPGNASDGKGLQEGGEGATTTAANFPRKNYPCYAPCYVGYVMISGLKCLIAAAALLAGAPVAAADAVADFYKGKTVTIVVGHEPGTGFDIYARTLQRHLGRHIPGNPGIVVQNMAGAGGITAANWLYKSRPGNGSVLATFVYTVPFEPLMGIAAARYEAAKFTWIGNMEEGVAVCGLSKAAGIGRFEDMRSKEVLIGGFRLDRRAGAVRVCGAQPVRCQDEGRGRLQGHRQHQDRDQPRRGARRLQPVDVDHHLGLARGLRVRQFPADHRASGRARIGPTFPMSTTTWRRTRTGRRMR